MNVLLDLDGTLTNPEEGIVACIRHALRSLVGDRRHDVVGALHNGIRPYGVLWGFGSREELTAAGAARLLESPSDLARIRL